MIKIIIALIAAVFGSTGFWGLMAALLRKKSNEARLIMGLAYAEIISRSELYIQKGFIATDEYNELSRNLYEPYKAMGGNGTAAKLIEEVKKLPTRKEA